MKWRESLSGVRRLRRLLSIGGEASRIGVSSSITHLPRKVCSESASSVDDSPFHFGEYFSLSDRVWSSYFSVLPPANSLFSSVSHPTFLPGSCPPQQYLYSSGHPFHSLFAAAPFATSRERVLDDEEEEVGGHEKQEVGETWRQRQPEAHTLLTEAEASPEEQFSEDTVSASDYGNGNEKAFKTGLEDDSTSGSVEVRKRWSELGWTREEVLNWPNAISMARLVSGPLLAWMILHEQWSPAFVGLVIAGISDWLDGYVARKMEINSVLGSYLDPVADKFLVGSVAVSMAYTGLLHPALVGLIVARDGGLMGGAFLYRAYSLGWQWKDRREFFRISIGGAGKVQPLYISKVNTVLQLVLVGVALLQPALSIQDTYSLVPLLSWSVVVTTSMSGVAYVHTYLKNPENLAALRRVDGAPSPKASQGSASGPLKS